MFIVLRYGNAWRSAGDEAVCGMVLQNPNTTLDTETPATAAAGCQELHKTETYRAFYLLLTTRARRSVRRKKVSYYNVVAFGCPQSKCFQPAPDLMPLPAAMGTIFLVEG